MPGLDGTGPRGSGPISGWGRGYCILRMEDGTTDGFAGIAGRRVGKPHNMEVSNMPGGDRTGPMGAGPMTGRAAGMCAGNAAPAYMNPGMAGGRGRGWWRAVGRGLGFGRGRRAVGMGPGLPPPGAVYGPAATREDELQLLKSQADGLQGALQDVQQRISQLGESRDAEQ